MSTRVPLEFFEFWDPRWLEYGIRVLTTRLIARVAFATPDGSATDKKRAIVDTGAPLALLPRSIWEQCAVKIMGQSTVGGIVPKPECQLAVHMGEVTCFLPAEDGATVATTLKAYLAPVDEVSLLLGFEGLLDCFRLVVDYPARNAFLEAV